MSSARIRHAPGELLHVTDRRRAAGSHPARCPAIRGEMNDRLSTTPGLHSFVSEECYREIVALLRSFLGSSHTALDHTPACDPRAVVSAAASLGVVRHVDVALKTARTRNAWHEELDSALRPAVRNHLAWSIRVYDEARAVTQALSAAGILHIPFKGPFLSKDLYDDPILRKATDVDIILPEGRADLPVALEALGALGYRLPELHPSLLDYCLTEKGQVTLVADGRVGVDMHHGTYHDLPGEAFSDVASRANRIQEQGHGRLVLQRLDLLMLLVTHYWIWPQVKWLVDVAVLLRDHATFCDGWEDRVRDWGLAFLAATAGEAVRREFGVEPAGQFLAGLKSKLRRRELSICERIARDGIGTLPKWLVLKTHRFHLPWKRRLKAFARLVWPHPGLVVHRTGCSRGKPDFLQRFVFVAKRLAAVMKLK